MREAIYSIFRCSTKVFTGAQVKRGDVLNSADMMKGWDKGRKERAKRGGKIRQSKVSKAFWLMFVFNERQDIRERYVRSEGKKER